MKNNNLVFALWETLFKRETHEKPYGNNQRCSDNSTDVFATVKHI